jgi:hypothetical protein
MKTSNALIVLVSAVLGCSDAAGPLDPSSFTGRYMLRAVNDSSLPRTVAALPDSCTWEFRLGSLVVGDGAFSAYLYGATACPGGTYDLGVPGTVGGGVAVQGNELVLTAIDPTSASGAVMTLRAQLTGADLAVTFPAGAMSLMESTVLTLGPRQGLP